MSSDPNINPSSDNQAGGEAVTKSKNQLKNEAKRAEKLKKFEEKQLKCGDLAEKANKNKANKVPLGSGSTTLPEVEEDSTVPGEKKNLTTPMAASYSPKQVESAWYAWWEKSGFFTPEYHHTSEEKYVMVLPPPNVTGSLHVGHAMMGAIEDALVRWQRMQGKQVLFLPGCDHAGIATQAVVEKKLAKESNMRRQDLGRKAFVEAVWKWKEQYGDRIYLQLKRMGLSLDWTRTRFTLDAGLSEAVREAFVRMYDDGLIFRANRLVNWCGKLQTALSDLEVDMVEVGANAWIEVTGNSKKKYEFGVMTSIAYAVEGGEGEVVIQTSRPETVFGDTAIAVNPGDSRYARFHGKRVVHPVTGKLLPIVLDEAADPNFGTGALKITPAHDHTDFAVGQRHDLPAISILDENNKLTERIVDLMGERGRGFVGMARYDAREAVIEFIKANGTFRGQSPHAHSLPVCSKSGDFVEPRLIPQWWCRCTDMAGEGLRASQDGRLDISPPEYQKIWQNWLENIHDWCLSRQLWWGHQIPAYKVSFPGLTSSEDVWVVGRTEEEAMRRALEKFPDAPKDKVRLDQDPDVLDTWFSSALWPFSTLGWPNLSSPDFVRFFPNTILETGGDILFFWVARMVMMSMYLTGKVPFSQVFLHAIVRDAQGRKMSKTLGNVVDPIDVIQGISLQELHATLERGNLDPREVEKAKAGQRMDFPNGIPECGTDALRFALCSYVAQGRDVNLNISRVESYRKFCNKLWNACKFALMKLGEGFVPGKEFVPKGNESSVDKWILHKLNEATKEVQANFEITNLMQATSAIHSFWLYDLCDVYIEAIKPTLSLENDSSTTARHVLYFCLEQGLRLLHPFMPYVTEELYQRLPRRPLDPIPSICVATFPKERESLRFLKESQEFERVFEVVKEIRSVAAEAKVPKGAALALHVTAKGELEMISKHKPEIDSLIKAVGSLQLADTLSGCSIQLKSIEGAAISFN